MNQEVKTVDPTLVPEKEVIGHNPDGTPIYKVETVQTPEHTGEAL
jgi:hypothetical protein